jgi:putative NADH-flavin reductase
MQRICVLGASRGAGAHVVRLACSQRSDVRAITRNPATAKVPDGANAMEDDVYDGQSYERLAVMAYKLKRMANVLGTVHLTHALQKN